MLYQIELHLLIICKDGLNFLLKMNKEKSIFLLVKCRLCYNLFLPVDDVSDWTLDADVFRKNSILIDT